MGGLLDDILDIRGEIGGLKDEFSGAIEEMGGREGREVREIWDPSRFDIRPGIDPSLCLDACGEGVECDLCARMCPADALTISQGHVAIDGKQCLGCALCIAECPTGALVSPKTNPPYLYKVIAGNAVNSEHSYISCARALGHTPPDNVHVLPCIGCLSVELWFSLLASYGNISIYLPLGACDNCECKVGEEMYTKAVALSEKWARETVGFECDESALKTQRNRDRERQRLMREMAGSATSFLGAANPIAKTAMAGIRQLEQYSRQMSSMQRMLDKATGHGAEEAPEKKRVLNANRQLFLMALKSYRDLAGGIKIALSKTDAAKCTSCEKCVNACPVGARAIPEGGNAEVASIYCLGCGACVDVCDSQAATLRLRSAEVLLDELSDVEKEIDRVKQQASDVANDLKEKGKQLLGA